MSEGSRAGLPFGLASVAPSPGSRDWESRLAQLEDSLRKLGRQIDSGASESPEGRESWLRLREEIFELRKVLELGAWGNPARVETKERARIDSLVRAWTQREAKRRVPESGTSGSRSGARKARSEGGDPAKEAQLRQDAARRFVAMRESLRVLNPRSPEEASSFRQVRSELQGGTSSSRRAWYLALAKASHPLRGEAAKLLQGIRDSAARCAGSESVEEASARAAGLSPGLLARAREALAKASGWRGELRATREAWLSRPLGLWDRTAPWPREVPRARALADDLAKLKGCFDPEFRAWSEFLAMADEKTWIWDRLPNQEVPAAQCVHLPASREVRVFIEPLERARSRGVLAHELGHGFHFYLRRELPANRPGISMVQAEAASLFFQFRALEAYRKACEDPSEAKALAWETLRALATFLGHDVLNWEFERSISDPRAWPNLSPEVLDQAYLRAHIQVWGEPVPEATPEAWIQEDFFFLPEIRFYNFPYVLGVMLAHGLGAGGDGASLSRGWERFLKDPVEGGLTQAVSRAFGEDLESEAFWTRALDAIQTKARHCQLVLGLPGQSVRTRPGL